jgi:hypothetical protein
MRGIEPISDSHIEAVTGIETHTGIAVVVLSKGSAP